MRVSWHDQRPARFDEGVGAHVVGVKNDHEIHFSAKLVAQVDKLEFAQPQVSPALNALSR